MAVVLGRVRDGVNVHRTTSLSIARLVSQGASGTPLLKEQLDIARYFVTAINSEIFNEKNVHSYLHASKLALHLKPHEILAK